MDSINYDPCNNKIEIFLDVEDEYDFGNRRPNIEPLSYHVTEIEIVNDKGDIINTIIEEEFDIVYAKAIMNRQELMINDYKYFVRFLAQYNILFDAEEILDYELAGTNANSKHRGKRYPNATLFYVKLRRTQEQNDRKQQNKFRSIS